MDADAPDLCGGVSTEPAQSQPCDMSNTKGNKTSSNLQACQGMASPDGNTEPDGAMMIDDMPLAEDQSSTHAEPGIKSTASTTAEGEQSAHESSPPTGPNSSVKVKSEEKDRPIGSIAQSHNPDQSQSKEVQIEASGDGPYIKREPDVDAEGEDLDTYLSDADSESSCCDDMNDEDFFINPDDMGDSDDDDWCEEDDEHEDNSRKAAKVKPEVKTEPGVSETTMPVSAPSASSTTNKKSGQKRTPPAEDAIEFWTRYKLQKDEKWRRKERKRKHDDDLGRNGPGESGRSAESLLSERPADAVDQDEAVPSMGIIVASNDREQWAAIKANMPKGGDTRRVARQEKDLKMASKSFGYKRILRVNGQWRIKKAMFTALMSHQLTLAAWMVKQEIVSGLSGGLVADAMGMGKTMVSLACMATHLPNSEEIQEWSKATLVVVPSQQIAYQWANEIWTHMRLGFANSAVIYISDKAVNSSNAIRHYKRKTVVITTYHEVIKSYPSPEEVAVLKEKYDSDQQSFNKAMRSKFGVLFRMNWWRVILDEAHHIKNSRSHTALACWDLSSKYRWCLSGTPLANTPREFYPYVKFLRCNFTSTRRKFEQKYTKGDFANENFEQLIQALMYRRTQKDSFLGCKIIDLPESTSHDIVLPLSHEEEVILESVEEYHRKRLKCAEEESDSEDSDEEDPEDTQDPPNQPNPGQDDDVPQSGSTQKQQKVPKKTIGISLLSAVSHPFNLETILRRKMEPNEVRTLRDNLKALESPVNIRQQLQEKAGDARGMTEFQRGLDKLAQLKHPVFSGTFDMKALLQFVYDEVRLRPARCSVCRKPPKKPVPSSTCDHIYCHQCLAKLMKKLGMAEYTKIDCPDKACDEAHKPGDSMTTLGNISAKAQKSKCFKEPGADVNKGRIILRPDRNGLFTACFWNKTLALPSSSKLLMAMAVILQWQGDFPEDKIIVFTQFLATGKTLGVMLQAAGMKFLYYYGALSAKHKNRAINDFKSDPRKKILICGLRAGSEGLNLTAANRVIVVDPWWNLTAENQAFGRVKRIGQGKKSHLVRIFTTANIDQRIVDMQETKAVKIDYALQDDGHTPVEVDDERLQHLFAPEGDTEEQ